MRVSLSDDNDYTQVDGYNSSASDLVAEKARVKALVQTELEKAQAGLTGVLAASEDLTAFDELAALKGELKRVTTIGGGPAVFSKIGLMPSKPRC